MVSSCFGIRVLPSLVLASCVGGCGGAPPPGIDDLSPDAATPDGEDEPCAGQADPGGSALCISQVTGAFLTIDGDEVPEAQLVTFCGPTCFTGSTAADGQFLVEEIENYVDVSEYSTLFHGRPDFAGYYFPAPAQVLGPELDAGEYRVFPMPPEGELLPDEFEDTLEMDSNGVRLEVPAGFVTVFDVEAAFGQDEDKRFRALEVDRQEAELAGIEVQDIQQFYALAPFETYFQLPDDTLRTRRLVRLSFPNALELDPGSSVEVLAHGSYLHTDYVQPARFEVVAEAVVTEDGERIEMLADEGIELLTWVGLQPG